MAYGKKFYTSYKSFNGWDYYMEFFIKDYAGLATEISLGQSGVSISYDTDSEDRDNPILASQMEIPFIVSSGTEQVFINDLRDTFEEQDVYVHLYKSTSANVQPLWSGFILMDLGAKEDVWYPYEVKLTATDGIALLKDRDFVKPGSTKPYQATDMYYGPSPFTDYISIILQKVGVAGTDEGAYSDAQFRTSVNWYNLEHTGTGQSVDPLYTTKGKINWTHKSDENGDYTPMSSYDVLKEIMKTWHCRIVYWNHIFWIVQIPEYNTSESGTNLNPINVPTRVYTLGGTADGNRAYLGGADIRYELIVGTDIQKLTGTKYQFYPRLKSVTAKYLTGGGTNYYGGFPTWNGTTLISPHQQYTIIDANAANDLYLSIPLNCSQSTSIDRFIRIKFDLKATNGTTTKWLKNDLTWVSSEPATYPTNYKPQVSGTIFGVNPQQILVFQETIPTDPAFTGAWEFELIVDGSGWGSSSGSYFSQDVNIGFGTFSFTPVDGNVIWTNIPGPVVSTGGITILSSAYQGQFLTLNSSSGINIAGQSILVETALSDSKNHDFGKMQWGDSQDATDPGNLLVWDGSAYVQTDFVGKWGKGTLVGTDSFTNLMMEEFIQGQASNIQIINTKFMVSESTKGTSSSPNFINPVGRIRESVMGDVNIYIFKRGTFFTSFDEWDYEGWSIKDEVIGLSTTTTSTWSPNGPASDDSGNMGL